MGEKRGLSAEAVVDAAVAIADHDGLEAATLATVAARLGIRSPSLYHYFAGADGLKRALALRGAAALGDELRAAAAGRSGRAALRALARAYRQFAHRHPGLYAAMLPAPRPGQDDVLYAALGEPVALVGAVLAELGVSSRRTVPVVRALRSLLHGFVTLERDGGFGMPEDVDASFDAAVELFTRALERQ
jgi:AcrR family transcriptional regulator